MIVDSSAILAIFFRETGARELLDEILSAGYAGIGAPTAAETGLVLSRHLNRNATVPLLGFFKEIGIEVVPFTDRHWQCAVAAFERFGKGRHPARLNFGDCLTYATAELANEPLLCLGEDFRQTDLELV